MGPWSHGGWSRSDGDSLGHVRFGSKTAVFYREQIELPFFKHYLKGKDDRQTARGLRLRDRHQPVAQGRRLAAEGRRSRSRSTSRPTGGLSFDAADRRAGAPSTSTSATRPSRCRTSADRRPGMTREHMIDDQRFASTRPDVLAYQTDALDDDVTLAGPLTASLFVSTTGTDSDWVVKLIDVYPDDYPDPDPNPDRRAHGRLSAAGARRSDARQVPQQLREARAVHARASWRRSNSRCPTSTTSSAAATASWCRCRAPGSRWWTAIRRSSWTSTTRRLPTS